jgi:hypothetical protein
VTAPGPITLHVSGVDFSESYTKTLFVNFASSPAIEAVSAQIQKATGSEYELKPHVSLLYKQMPEAQKTEAAHGLSLPVERVEFDSIKAVLTPSPITGPADINAWRTLASRRLGSATA